MPLLKGVNGSSKNPCCISLKAAVKKASYCAVPENIPLPSQKGIEFPGGGGSVRPNIVKKL